MLVRRLLDRHKVGHLGILSGLVPGDFLEVWLFGIVGGVFARRLDAFF